ncbi:hypothetical protein MANES_18G141009v8 [Manihot esculenta]|uniref:Uncharacterized protein n=1 Tax=Manihot esculenta TaxID=3983 RepID=A0ACB7G0X9_MANES|nr:hypothetical protein MANES_18G141009v8 [Manihot esculenta]
MSNNLSLHSILDTNKLIGPNFLDWYHNLRIILKQENRLYVLNQGIPDVPDENASDDVKDKYDRHIDDDMQATCVMLASITLELQKQHENMDACTIIFHFKELFRPQRRTERCKTSKELFSWKMTKDSLVHAYGFVIDHELSVDLVLQSLPSSLAQFIMNFKMHKLDTELPELVSMLVNAEKSLKKEKVSVLLI